ncbi:MAG: HEAT repeat domain-containing protein [Myxococcota bacterium]
MLEKVSDTGPWSGQCPSCAEPATGSATWLRVRSTTQQATLMLAPSQRGELIEELRAHLSRVQARGESVPSWMLSPDFEVTEARGGRRDETTARRSYSELAAMQPSGPAADAEQTDVRREPSRPVPVARKPSSPEPAAAEPEGATAVVEVQPEPAAAQLPVSEPIALLSSREDPNAGVPQLIGADLPSPEVARRPSTIGAHVADLTLDEVVTFRVRVTSDELPQWEAAHLSVRPIHLRGRGYPLVGVRAVGSYMGQVGCIDAVVDVGSTLATDVFRRLSERFVATLVIEHGSRVIPREIEASGLEANAALCIESARGILARGEYPPQEFDKARRALEAEPTDVRLAPPPVSLSKGAYQHIIGAREAVAALEHLERVSQKETLARLLEVDGLPMAEYDEIRRRVLEGSLAHGLCAPRRFWRRLVASGLANDLADYAQRLCANRAAHQGEEGDLDEEANRDAWLAIHELCLRKEIPLPAELCRALELPEPAASPPPPPGRATAGEIRSGEINSAAPPPSPVPPEALGRRLRDPGQRLRAATEVLQGRASADDVGQVIDALEEFERDELLALLPDLSDLGSRVVPGLIAKLPSERREVRQAAAILLGMSREPNAMQRLSDHLVREPTTVWLDIARALGWYGTAAIRCLCQLLAHEAASPREQLAIDRVSRALAEIAVSQDSGHDAQTGHEAVRALADAPDPRVSTAARRAMASLAEVTASGAQIRGEMPMSEVTEIRAFARLAYEAIMVPELEVEAEA